MPIPPLKTLTAVTSCVSLAGCMSSGTLAADRSRDGDVIYRHESIPPLGR